MTEEAFVILINLEAYLGILLHYLRPDGLFESLYDALKYWLVENELLSAHHSHDIAPCQQLACLQDDAVGSGVEDIDP